MYAIRSYYGLTDIRQISVALAGGCAVDMTDRLFCWGSNETGFVVALAVKPGMMVPLLRRFTGREVTLLLGDPERRTELGIRARTKVLAGFTLERMVEGTIGAYEQLTGRGKGTTRQSSERA